MQREVLVGRTEPAGADTVVLLLAGGQPAGPGLPVSVQPSGAHHRVGALPAAPHCPHLCPGWGILLQASCAEIDLGK